MCQLEKKEIKGPTAKLYLGFCRNWRCAALGVGQAGTQEKEREMRGEGD